jgi:hypothetical protein
MKLIGMFYSNSRDMIEAFRLHSQNYQTLARNYGSVTVNPAEMKIVVDDRKWLYYSFPNDDNINRIAGLQFDAVFSEVVDPKAKWFIMSRFRPGLNK